MSRALKAYSRVWRLREPFVIARGTMSTAEVREVIGSFVEAAHDLGIGESTLLNALLNALLDADLDVAFDEVVLVLGGFHQFLQVPPGGLGSSIQDNRGQSFALGCGGASVTDGVKNARRADLGLHVQGGQAGQEQQQVRARALVGRCVDGVDDDRPQVPARVTHRDGLIHGSRVRFSRKQSLSKLFLANRCQLRSSGSRPLTSLCRAGGPVSVAAEELGRRLLDRGLGGADPGDPGTERAGGQYRGDRAHVRILWGVLVPALDQ